MKTSSTIIIAVVTFAVALAYTLGSRLSDAAINVIVGIVLMGVFGVVPIATIAGIALKSNDLRNEHPNPIQLNPQIYLIAAPRSKQIQTDHRADVYDTREFKIVGGE